MKNKNLCWLLPMRCLFFIGSFLIVSALTEKSLFELSRWWAVLLIVINILVLLALLYLTKGKYADFINYQKGKTTISVVVLTVILTIVVGMGGMYAAGFICYGEFPYANIVMVQPMPIYAAGFICYGEFPYANIVMVQPMPIYAAVICLLLLPLSTTLAEDGIYLGVINKTNGNKGVSLASALFYAGQHSFIPLLPDARFMLYRFLSFLPLAIIFCFWYRQNRNPLPFMIGHFIINLSTVAMLMAAAISPDIFNNL